MIHGIPHYILIDPDGKIIQSNAPGPDDIESVLLKLTESAS